MGTYYTKVRYVCKFPRTVLDQLSRDAIKEKNSSTTTGCFSYISSRSSGRRTNVQMINDCLLNLSEFFLESAYSTLTLLNGTVDGLTARIRLEIIPEF